MSQATKIAIITGGSRGLGRSTALHLADRNVDVILTYKSNQAEAEEVVKSFAAKGRQAVALPLDVADSPSYPAFAERVRHELRERWGRDSFDFLVNNAGVGLHQMLTDTTEDEFDTLVKVHLKPTLFLTNALLPLQADGGRIINLSSGLARFSLPGIGAYAAMKGAIEVLSRYQAKELASRQIRVNVVAPGAIATDFSGGMVRDNPQVNQMVASQTALGRVGQPDDIGAAIAALLGDEFGWVNGQRLEISGGIFL